MQIHFNDDDFCGERAEGTARLMRVLADMLAPQALVCDPKRATPEQLAALMQSFGKDVQHSSLQPLAEAMVNARTVATHVSAEAAGDVPFPEPIPFAGVDPKFYPGSNPECPQEYPEQSRPNETPPAPTNGVDSAGNPWDERIHASSRATVADGTWRMKRGVSDELVAQVRAEWGAKLRPAPVAPAPTEAERLQADHVSTMPPDPATVGFGGAPAVPPPPAAADTWPTDILGARDESLTPFQQFMQWVMPKIQSAQLTNARLLEVLNANGVPLLPSLASPEHADKIGAIVRSL
jgi:hypothetical protein